MNVYVESNFVLELALLQEQHAACESILQLCEAGELRLVLPAYSLAEPYEALRRRHSDRKHLKISLEAQFRQLSRTAVYTDQLRGFESMTSLLVDSAEEDMRRLESVRARLLTCAELIPLEGSIFTRAVAYQTKHGLSAQDAVVYASIIVRLERSNQPPSCFLNRDAGFADPDIVEELRLLGCKFLAGFEPGLQFLRRPPREPISE